MNSIERAKNAINVKSHADLARFLAVAPSTIQGYEKRGSLPLEQFIKISEQTGVSLDWLILGKGEAHPKNTEQSPIAPDVQMLLTGWQGLTTASKAKILQAVLHELAQQHHQD